MQRGDEALNAMNPGGVERRVSVEFSRFQFKR
jgi:hypothetical protein